MRKQIAAANWKMNLTLQKGTELIEKILEQNINLAEHQEAIFAVPFPYLQAALKQVDGKSNYYVAARTVIFKNQVLLPGK